MRTYIVLIERDVSTDVGDTAFVLLGYYDAATRANAKRKAWRDHGITTAADLVRTVAVAAGSWRG